MIISIIAAMEEGNKGIGYQGELPWALPADLDHFRSVTMGHCLIMGRKTYENIGGPLPGRKTIVLTRVDCQDADDLGVELASSIQEAVQIADTKLRETEAFIAGGGELYKGALALGIVERMYLTIVHAALEADVFFPIFDTSEWLERWAIYHPADVENQYSFTKTLLERDSIDLG